MRQPPREPPALITPGHSRRRPFPPGGWAVPFGKCRLLRGWPRLCGAFRFFALVLALTTFSAAALAQVTAIPWHPKTTSQPPKGVPAPKAAAGTPAEPSKYLLTFDKITTVSPGVYLAEGNVRFTYEDMLLTADAVTYDSQKGTLWATGQVAVDWQDFTLTGTELRYDLNAGTGSMFDAYGVQKDGDFTVVGREIKKSGVDWYEVEDGLFTSCTSAVPPWSLKTSRTRFHVDHYAFLTNPRFRVRSASVVYLPYLVWPIKPDRSTGLLIPEVGTSSKLGVAVSTAVFIAPKDWWDDTVYLDYYSKEGFGLGEEFRYALTPLSYGWLHGYYIKQTSDDRRRWAATWTHLQNLKRGWYAAADINLLSDINFPRDYQRDYAKGTIAGIDSRIFVARNWSAYSLTAKLERRTQYFTENRDLVQRTLPGVELRSSLQSLGKGFYFGFDTSADSFHKEWAGDEPVPVQHLADYQRVDMHPFFERPFHPAPWLDVSPRVELRATGYTHSLDEESGEYDGSALLRSYVRGTLEMAGPRLFRRFKGGNKHVLEPFVTYTYISKDDNASRIPIFDEVDTIPLDWNQARYGVRNRLYGKTGQLLMDSELYQDHSFNRDLSVQGKLTSQYSPVSLFIRVWPTASWSADLRLRWSILEHTLDSTSFSLTYKPKAKDSEDFVRVTYLKTRQLGTSSFTDWTTNPAAQEIRIAAYLTLLRDRITFNPVLERDLLNKAWRNIHVIFWYHGSCYSIGVEGGRRNIGAFRDTQYRLLVSLKGAGTVLDLNAGTGTYAP